MEPLAYIIIINWNRKDDTLECLESVKKINYRNYSTIVVDNGSSDGSQEVIKKNHPWAMFIEIGENLGFAEGNNVGIRVALADGAEYIFLLNNDAIIDPNALQSLIEFAETQPDIGIVGPKILFYGDPNRIWFAGGGLDIVRGATHRGIRRIDNGEYDDILETDYITGCALLIKSKVINKVGMLRPEYFLLFEETDWCVRAKEAGYKIYYVPNAKVWHKCSSSFGGALSPIYIYYYVRNNLLFIKLNIKGLKKIRAYIYAVKRFLKWKRREGILYTPNIVAILTGIMDFYLKKNGRRENIDFRSSLLSLLLLYKSSE